MATQYYTHGPCVPQVSTGANSAYEVLGVARRGATVGVTYHRKEIKSDAGGDAPVEIQAMGSEASISMELVHIDTAVLDKIRYRSEGHTTVGQGGVPGVLLGTGSHLFGLTLPSSTGTPWTFAKCLLEQDEGTYGTENSEPRLRFKAIRYIAGSAVTTQNVALYTRAAP